MNWQRLDSTREFGASKDQIDHYKGIDHKARGMVVVEEKIDADYERYAHPGAPTHPPGVLRKISFH